MGEATEMVVKQSKRIMEMMDVIERLQAETEALKEEAAILREAFKGFHRSGGKAKAIGEEPVVIKLIADLNLMRKENKTLRLTLAETRDEVEDFKNMIDALSDAYSGVIQTAKGGAE